VAEERFKNETTEEARKRKGRKQRKIWTVRKTEDNNKSEGFLSAQVYIRTRLTCNYDSDDEFKMEGPSSHLPHHPFVPLFLLLLRQSGSTGAISIRRNRC